MRCLPIPIIYKDKHIMKLALLLLFILLIPFQAVASGFGWYVSAIDWEEFSSHGKGLVETANDIMRVKQIWQLIGL